jgi:hypothetical protein
MFPAEATEHFRQRYGGNSDIEPDFLSSSDDGSLVLSKQTTNH